MENSTGNIKVKPLKKSSEFLEITKKGQKTKVTSWLTLVVKKSNDGCSYFGITVSRKVGSAVVRNKLKRWVRDCVRSKTKAKTFDGNSVVFLFRPQTEEFYKKLQFKDFKLAIAAV